MWVQFPLPTPKEKINMSILDIIELLKEQGHSVQYYHRKDGGYVITRINGQSFRGKSGNVVARQMTGQVLSHARIIQLARIRTHKGHFGAEKKEPLPKELIKEMRKVQRAWRKNHPDIRGTISTSNVRYYYTNYGKEKTLEALDKNMRYAQGLTYIDNVNFLLDRIKGNLDKDGSSAMQEVYDLIKNKALEMREEWMQQLHYDCLQEWENGRISAEECARRMKEIMSF